MSAHRITAITIWALADAFAAYRRERTLSSAEAFLRHVDHVIDVIDFNDAYGPADRESLAAMNGAIASASNDRTRESLTTVRDAAIVGWADAIATEYEAATKKGES